MGVRRQRWDGRLARTFFSLFLSVAMVPLLISGVLSTTAVSQLADGLQRRHQAELTRQVSRQVLDHLLACKTALVSARSVGISEMLPLTGAGDTALFVSAADVRPKEPSDPQAKALLQAWDAADVLPGLRASRASLSGGRMPSQLRVLHEGPGGSRLLMAVGEGPTPDVVAELNPAYVWAPVDDAMDAGHWLIQDGLGHTLRTTPGKTLRAYDGAVTSQTHLFMGAEFLAGDWVFWQTSPAVRVQWQGGALTTWLSLVGLASLLGIALISHSQIRRVLAPLSMLITGTRQLAAGDAVTRISVTADNEIGELAGAFNEMADRIESQLRELKGLAAIDQCILSGRSTEALMREALARLAQPHPGASCWICWPERGPFLHALASGVGVAPSDDTRLVGLAPEVWHDFISAHSDEIHDLASRVPRWIGSVVALRRGSCRTWPVRVGDVCVAQLVVVPGADDSEAAWQHASVLRDRLAVAFAARKREDELAHRAVHDSLTGLANRYGLHEHLDQLLQGDALAAPVAALFLDLDRFKDVNDTLGHDAGDELLCLASERLQSCLGTGALLARRGGDEFVVVQPGLDDEGARALAADVVKVMAQPFVLRGREMLLGASVGVALAPVHARDRTELLRCADLAMYAAKAAGRGCYAMYAQALDTQTQERVRVLAELRQGLERGELRAHYQPRVCVQDGRSVSAEALVRWQHPTRGLLMPGSFIAWAEESPLIEDIGDWMLAEVCRQMVAWQDAGVPLERVSVNVSPRQLASGRLPARVKALLHQHGLSAAHLELEVTESLLVGDARSACAQLNELRGMGVQVALDDFGTGYSSLSVLRQLPIDIMKVDRSFVKDLGQDDGALAVTQAIVAMAQALQLHIVAEGMETAEQAAILIELGCHELQGFHYSRPLPEPDLVAWLQRMPA